MIKFATTSGLIFAYFQLTVIGVRTNQSRCMCPRGDVRCMCKFHTKFSDKIYIFVVVPRICNNNNSLSLTTPDKRPFSVSLALTHDTNKTNLFLCQVGIHVQHLRNISIHIFMFQISSQIRISFIKFNIGVGLLATLSTLAINVGHLLKTSVPTASSSGHLSSHCIQFRAPQFPLHPVQGTSVPTASSSGHSKITCWLVRGASLHHLHRGRGHWIFVQ